MFRFSCSLSCVADMHGRKRRYMSNSLLLEVVLIHDLLQASLVIPSSVCLSVWHFCFREEDHFLSLCLFCWLNHTHERNAVSLSGSTSLVVLIEDPSSPFLSMNERKWRKNESECRENSDAWLGWWFLGWFLSLSNPGLTLLLFSCPQSKRELLLMLESQTASSGSWTCYGMLSLQKEE